MFWKCIRDLTEWNSKTEQPKGLQEILDLGSSNEAIKIKVSSREIWGFQGQGVGKPSLFLILWNFTPHSKFRKEKKLTNLHQILTGFSIQPNQRNLKGTSSIRKVPRVYSRCLHPIKIPAFTCLHRSGPVLIHTSCPTLNVSSVPLTTKTAHFSNTYVLSIVWRGRLLPAGTSSACTILSKAVWASEISRSRWFVPWHLANIQIRSSNIPRNPGPQEVVSQHTEVCWTGLDYRLFFAFIANTLSFWQHEKCETKLPWKLSIRGEAKTSPEARSFCFLWNRAKSRLSGGSSHGE